MFPPSIYLTFNPDLVHDDGLIAHSVARREGISFESAVREVANEVEALRHQLDSDGELSLGLLGRLVRQKGSTPLFEAAPRWVESATGYMSALDIRPVMERAKEEATLARIESNRHRAVLKRRVRRVARFAAAIVGVIAVASAVLFSPVFNSRTDNMASLSEYPVQVSTSMQTSIAPVTDNSAHVLCILAPVESSAAYSQESLVTDGADADSADLIVPDSVTAVISTDAVSTQGRYCLIVASLTSRALAEKFIAESNDSTLQILEKDGKYRIYAATGDTSDEALAHKHDAGIAGRYPDAWVCRR